MRAVNFLPWVAALSFGAFVAVLPTLYFGAKFALIFPIALGVCSVIGVPIALRWRGNAGWLMPVGIVLGLGILIAVIKALAYLSGLGGEALGWVLAMTISSAALALPIALAIAMAIGLVAGPTALVVLFLSGEMAAIKRGTSIYDLPHRRLRASLLVLLATGPPLAAYAIQSASGGYRSYAEAFGEDCRYDNNTSRLMRQKDVYIDADKPDWPALKQLVEKFAASHTMRMVPGDPRSFGRDDTFEYGVCMPGRFVFSFAKTPDVPNKLFESKGDWYVTLTPYVAKGESWEDPLRDLAAEIGSQWSGIKLGSYMELGQSLNWQKTDPEACRTKVAKFEYKSCLGTLSDVQKEKLYVHGPINDWPRLESLMTKYAASHGMTFSTDKNNRTLPWNSLCAPGKVQINSSADVREVPLVRSEHFHVQIMTYVPATDPDAAAAIDQLVAGLDAEWPGVMRSRPEPDFCRVFKAQK